MSIQNNAVARPAGAYAVPPRREPCAGAKAIAEVAEKQHAYLLHLAGRQMGSDLLTKGDASDMVQQTCLEALRDSDTLHGDSEAAIKAWLRTILLNNVRSFSRKYRSSSARGVLREVSLERFLAEGNGPDGLAVEGPAPGVRLIDEEVSQTLWAAVARLPESDRRLTNDRVMDGLSFKEIGKRRGCSAVAARKRWLRVVDRLRRELKPVVS